MIKNPPNNVIILAKKSTGLSNQSLGSKPDGDEFHEFHRCMCKPCGNINFQRRNFKKDMNGKIAIITGGRIKIGYETAIRLLHNGCQVIVTSRFVDDCASRYQKDP